MCCVGASSPTRPRSLLTSSRASRARRSGRSTATFPAGATSMSSHRLCPKALGARYPLRSATTRRAPTAGTSCGSWSRRHCLDAALRDREGGVTEPLVDIRTGQPATPKATRAEAAARASAAVKDAESDPNVLPIVIRLLTYLNLLLPMQPFTALLRPDLLRRVEAFIMTTFATEPGSLYYAVGACQSIRLNPRPHYHTTPRSVRLSPYGLNLAMLQSKVRQFWTALAGWIEMDLSNSQLAINAVRWNVQSVIETLRDPNYSVWPDLIQHLGGDVADIKARELYKPVKAALKVVVYGVCFGMGLKNLRQIGGDNAKKVREHRQVVEEVFGMTHKEAGKRLLKHPIIAALLVARDVEIERVMAAGGLTDCFGRWIAVEGRTIAARRAAARSALAQAAQAEEMAILAPVIDAAIEEAKKAKSKKRAVRCGGSCCGSTTASPCGSRKSVTGKRWWRSCSDWWRKRLLEGGFLRGWRSRNARWDRVPEGYFPLRRLRYRPYQFVPRKRDPKC